MARRSGRQVPRPSVSENHDTVICAPRVVYAPSRTAAGPNAGVRQGERRPGRDPIVGSFYILAFRPLAIGHKPGCSRPLRVATLRYLGRSAFTNEADTITYCLVCFILSMSSEHAKPKCGPRQFAGVTKPIRWAGIDDIEREGGLRGVGLFYILTCPTPSPDFQPSEIPCKYLSGTLLAYCYISLHLSSNSGICSQKQTAA
jgi:hypothetical protein